MTFYAKAHFQYGDNKSTLPVDVEVSENGETSEVFVKSILALVNRNPEDYDLVLKKYVGVDEEENKAIYLRVDKIHGWYAIFPGEEYHLIAKVFLGAFFGHNLFFRPKIKPKIFRKMYLRKKPLLLLRQCQRLTKQRIKRVTYVFLFLISL